MNLRRCTALVHVNLAYSSSNTLAAAFSSSSNRPLKMSDSEQPLDPLSRHALPSPLLLGSASFTRKLILREMNIPFHVVVRPIDEKAIGDRSEDPPETLVLKVARAKMDSLISDMANGKCNDELPTHEGEYVVLTGDQVITCNNIILEKPQSIQEAKQFVQMYASDPPSTVGSVILTHYPSGATVQGTDRATIYFRETVAHIDPATSMDLVDRMLNDDAPILSCAGGLMIEHPFVREHVDKIDGTEDSVMGLSKLLVERLLGELRLKLNDMSH